ncbi:hypothetical protein RCH10_002029 [Variovorax sp. GrIS 2.14]|uniref:hypothetical protein n=1 Tax=Variovorax sp. GrIS 2.14 TaxID=3071709 RepID=UPI0038F72C5C
MVALIDGALLLLKVQTYAAPASMLPGGMVMVLDAATSAGELPVAAALVSAQLTEVVYPATAVSVTVAAVLTDPRCSVAEVTVVPDVVVVTLSVVFVTPLSVNPKAPVPPVDRLATVTVGSTVLVSVQVRFSVPEVLLAGGAVAVKLPL